MTSSDASKATARSESYELHDSSSSPSSTRSSIQTKDLKNIDESPVPMSPPPPHSHSHTQITPSIRLLFSFIPRKQLILLVLPAVIASVIAGGVAPFMTFVVGQAFDAFARFSTSSSSNDGEPQLAKDDLLRSVGVAALELIGLAVGSLALSSITSCLWIWIGEMNVMGLRKAVYTAISQKELAWFDTNMGAEEAPVDDHQAPLGAGGLMAKFSRETDEVRMASSLASGMLIQYLTTCITCLVLAFMRSWALTLVILSALPVLVIIQGLTQGLAAPLLSHEREQTGAAATTIERAATAITTVKAFNASNIEYSRAKVIFGRMQHAAQRLTSLWAVASGVSQFVMMAMFVQGFWFGSKLVREGRISAGDVMAVFWACLIASSNLQMCVPQFIVLAKGKLGVVALLSLMAEDEGHSVNDITPLQYRKLAPSRCAGGLALYDVTFMYPSRPSVPVLSDVSLFLPANDTTFIVGSSGSGKSTIAHLLLNMYEPQKGVINLDELDLQSLDKTWLRSHVACVGQQGAAGVVIFEDKSVFENVAAAVYGHSPFPPTRAQVEDACRAALMHEFIRDLPQGYDTLLGGGSGVGLSGGQKQRLSIARAVLRDPTVLILDEATSALDATSRILVFEAVKRRRRNKTTIVITHDLSQIEPQDFVYVLKNGRVVEQGYRSDLEVVVMSKCNDGNCDKGEFRKLMESQRETGGFLPEKQVVDTNTTRSMQDLKDQFEKGQVEEDEKRHSKFPDYFKHQSLGLRPVTFGAWMFDVVGDLTAVKSPVSPSSPPETPTTMSPPRRNSRRLSRLGHQRRPSSVHIPIPEIVLPTSPSAAYILPGTGRRYSLPPTPTSVTFTANYNYCSTPVVVLDSDDGFDKEKRTIERSAMTARNARSSRPGTRTRWDGSRDAVLSYIKVEKSTTTGVDPTSSNGTDEDDDRPPAFWDLMHRVYESLPGKFLLFFGFVICIVNGAMTPIFSFLLSRLLFEVSIGAQDVNAINFFGGLVLGAAALEGFFLGLKFFIMETAGLAWVTSMRLKSFTKILSQDKSWFDKPHHSPSRLVQKLVKDGEDARDLVAVVWAQCCVVLAMVGVGLVWAFVRGWQLTLAGVAIAPVFAVGMAVQTGLVAKCEARNKGAREEVARHYYETLINIRGIRSMAFDAAFKKQFDTSVDESLTTGVRGAMIEGCTYGVASGLIYLAEALLFYVGAVLIARGVYTYLQMVEVLNLVVFSITIGSQLMGFTQKMAKAVQATADFEKLARLDTETQESHGSLRPKISGTIRFNNVSFSYPERPKALVLRHMNLRIGAGECVAVVGTSGSGKSTIASLLQRLYEPYMGSVTIGDIDTRLVDVRHLRDNVSVVSQQPHLFDVSIADNIRYGHPAIEDEDVRYAAQAANIHDFIMTLPQGYDTLVGENASLISGGQAQRIQIARALVRPSRILILDECTSSLDAENRAAVLDAVYSVKAQRGRTTVMITHDLEAMRMCDRIIVVQDGEVVEEGEYERLMERKGVFASLARGGEWVG